MGFLLIGIACGTFEGIQATVIYLLIYIVMNLCILQFYLNTFFIHLNNNIEFLTDLRHYPFTENKNN